MRIEARPIMVKRGGWICLICRRRMKGAIFCHVETISPVFRLTPWITSGIHVCIGARPSFSKRAKVIIEVKRGWDMC